MPATNGGNARNSTAEAKARRERLIARELRETTVKPSTHYKLRHFDWWELNRTYQLLARALPLALQRLEQGGVDAGVQYAFWLALNDIVGRWHACYEIEWVQMGNPASMQQLCDEVAAFYHELSERARER